jgi:hypothetical protein
MSFEREGCGRSKKIKLGTTNKADRGCGGLELLKLMLLYNKSN